MLSRLRGILRGNFLGSRVASGRSLQLLLDARLLVSLIPSSIVEAESTSNLPFEEELAGHGPKICNYLHRSIVSNLNLTYESLKTGKRLTDINRGTSFEPYVSESGVTNAGNGLFIRGKASKGSLISLYPGLSLAPCERREHVVHEHCIARYDGYIVDARQMPLLEWPSDLDDRDTENDDSESEFVHPFAQAHMINHPPIGIYPNVLQFMIDIDVSAMPKHLSSLLPISPSISSHTLLQRLENLALRQRIRGVDAFRSSAPDQRVARTVAFIAIRDIEDEEVFYDYRFPPQVETPSWYWQCDPEASKRRWNKTGVFR